MFVVDFLLGVGIAGCLGSELFGRRCVKLAINIKTSPLTQCGPRKSPLEGQGLSCIVLQNNGWVVGRYKRDVTYSIRVLFAKMAGLGL